MPTRTSANIDEYQAKAPPPKSWKPKLIAAAVLGTILLLAGFLLVDVEHIGGNEIGVRETWSEGVVREPLTSKTYFFFPGYSNKVYRYDLSSQNFVMNDTPVDKEHGTGRDADAYLVQSKDSQDMKISLSVRWRIDPAKVIDVHKTVRTDIEEKLIRNEVQRVVKNEATMRTAIEAYSGAGLVQLQNAIQTDLMSPTGSLARRGIIVENFVIEHIRLDPAYTKEITDRQVAIQRKLRADAETDASNALAIKAKADAQADYNKRVVEAERDKAVAILAAEQEAQKTVLAAKAAAEQTTVAADAEKKKTVLGAEGEAEAGKLRGEAILAVGKAQAEAQKLQFLAYNEPGSETYAKIQIATSMGNAYSGIKGYLPGDMKVNVLSGSFVDALNSFVHGK